MNICYVDTLRCVVAHSSRRSLEALTAQTPSTRRTLSAACPTVFVCSSKDAVVTFRCMHSHRRHRYFPMLMLSLSLSCFQFSLRHAASHTTHERQILSFFRSVHFQFIRCRLTLRVHSVFTGSFIVTVAIYNSV